MIIRVRPRGLHVRDVLRYLFGPGEQGEHESPHLVAAWAGSTIGGVADLQPEPTPGGGFALGRLSVLLEQPVIAAVRAPLRPVWHGSAHSHPAAPSLTDGQWAGIAAEMVDAIGAAPFGDFDGVRWVAIRHGSHGGDHVHVVATLVRQDGRTTGPRNDYWRCLAFARVLDARPELQQGGSVGVTRAEHD